MRLSCSAIAWGEVKDVPTFTRIVRTIKDTGYEGVGIEYNLLPQALRWNPEQVKEIAKDAGLEVPSMAINENNPYQAEAAQRMGAESGWLCLFEKDPAGAAEMTRLHLREFGKRKLKVGIHPHVKSNVETTAQLDALISACKPAKVEICFDSAHQEALSMDLPAFITRYRDLLCLAHMKDLRAKVAPKDVDYDHDFVDLGDGVVDFPPIMEALRKVGYKGWLMTEVDYAHKITVEESVRRNFDYLERLM